MTTHKKSVPISRVPTVQDSVTHRSPFPRAQAEPERLAYLQQMLMEKAGNLSPDLIRYVRSPLRICPLGAHIDHQLGVVTGMTIDQSILLAFVPVAERSVTLYSTDFDTVVRFELDELPPFVPGDWGNYARGAVSALGQTLKLSHGLVGVLGGSMPIGGLSSSAAVTIAYLMALEEIHGGVLSAAENVQLCRATENGYIGLNNGILDQSVILYNQHERLTRIDCQSLDVVQIDAPSSMNQAYEIMVVYSGVGKALVGTDYNRRVDECREAAALLLTAVGRGDEVGDHTRLRHVEPAIFQEQGEGLPAPLYRRARHFFGEMERVEAGRAAWHGGDLGAFGALMTESGASSIRWYESGSPPLITLYDALCSAPGVYGARFSGAGFRGNCIALVDPARRDEAAEVIHSRYPAAHPEYADRYSIHFCRPGTGATLLDAGFSPIASHV